MNIKQNIDYENNNKIKILYLSVPPTYEFVSTSRGTRILSLKGYRFTKQDYSTMSNKSRWRCCRHSFGCKAAVFTIDDEIVMLKYYHNHPPPGDI